MARTGKETIVGLASGGTWHTAVAPGATEGILPASIDPVVLQGDPIPNLTIGNWTEIQEMDLLQHDAKPTIVLPLSREGAIWRFFANFFGDDTTSGAADPYTHLFNWQQVSGIFSTMALEINDSDIIEWPSLKVRQIELSPDGEGKVQISVETICDTVKIAGDATSTGSDFDSVTYSSKTKIIPSREARIRMNAQGGAGLGSGDEVDAMNYTLMLSRPLEDYLPTEGASDNTEKQTAEPPQRGEPVEMTFGFDLDDYTTIGDLDDLKDETEYKADLQYSKTISTVTHSILFEMARLHPIPASAAIEAGAKVPLTKNFRLKHPTAAPTGMTSTSIIYLTVDNTDDTTWE